MSVKPAFQPDIVILDVATVVPIKTITAAFRKSEVYRRIAASLAHLGLIEPLVVFPTAKGTYLLLDGHTRLDVLAATGVTTIKCLLSTENESYTYNKRVNYLPPIAQHHMILKALAHVSEDRIAKALDVSVGRIRAKRDLLKGICPEAAELLHHERVTGDAFNALRKMKSIRQVEVARLMLTSRRFTGRFARALLDGTPDELLVEVPKRKRDLTSSEKSTLERETDEMLKRAESIRANYGNDVLDQTAACRHVGRLLSNPRIRRYLAKYHEEILATLQQILTETDAEQRQRGRPLKAATLNGVAEPISRQGPTETLQ